MLIQFRVTACLSPESPRPSSSRATVYSWLTFPVFCFPHCRFATGLSKVEQRGLGFSLGERRGSLLRVRFRARGPRWQMAGDYCWFKLTTVCRGSGKGEGRTWIIARAVTNYSRMTRLAAWRRVPIVADVTNDDTGIPCRSLISSTTRKSRVTFPQFRCLCRDFIIN